MRLVFQAVLRSLPQILRLVVAISFFFTWISIVMVKVYKDDEYHCDNAYAVAETKEECLEWGGDWVKRTLNFQSLMSTLVIGTAICVMEGWSYHMAETMDLRGKGNAPSYNSNEHIQIFYLSVFFGGMILVNFFVSIMMLSYTRAKQALSGEKGLTAIQRKWLNVKTYILSLEPQNRNGCQSIASGDSCSGSASIRLIKRFRVSRFSRSWSSLPSTASTSMPTPRPSTGKLLVSTSAYHCWTIS